MLAALTHFITHERSSGSTAHCAKRSAQERIACYTAEYRSGTDADLLVAWGCGAAGQCDEACSSAGDQEFGFHVVTSLTML
jgi:hypothetical protein